MPGGHARLQMDQGVIVQLGAAQVRELNTVCIPRGGAIVHDVPTHGELLLRRENDSLPGDCQINLQSSSLGTVGVGAGEGAGTVGVSDSIGFGVADANVRGGLVGEGLADEDVAEVFVGFGVVDGRGVRDRLGLAVVRGTL